MLKRRLCIALLFNDGVLFRTKKFTPDYRYTVNFVGVDAVDEVFLIDITRGGPSQASWDAMKAYAERCYSPVTMGGHIKTLDDCKRFFDLGSDKVLLGSIALGAPAFIEKVAKKYGSQAATVALDTDGVDVVSARTGVRAPIGPVAFALHAEACGAGEVFLQNRDMDGSLRGYDTATLLDIADAVRIPIVVGTACGNAGHMRKAFDCGASGAATSNIFHFTDTAIRGFKKQLTEYCRP